MRRLSQAMLLLAICVGCSCYLPGQRDQTAPRDGILVGNVFAARPDGSLVPARTATVVLAPASAAEPLIAASGDLSKVLFDAHAVTSSLSAEQNRQMEELAETERLKALLQSLKPLRDKVLPVFQSTKTDANGDFTFTGMPSDKYILIAIGHAGPTAGLWLAKLTIKPGLSQAVTMNIPVVACYDPENYLSIDKPDAELDRALRLLTTREKELQASLYIPDHAPSSPSLTNTTALAETIEAPPADGPGTAFVDCRRVTRQLEAYSEPSYPSPVIASLKCGEPVTVICEQRGWVRVKTPANVEGYVSFNFLTGSPVPKTCTGPSLAPQVEDVSAPPATEERVTGPGSKGVKEGDFNIDFYVQARGRGGSSACWMDLRTETAVYSVSYHGGGCVLFTAGEHISGRIMPHGNRSEVQVLGYDRKQQLRIYFYRIYEERAR